MARNIRQEFGLDYLIPDGKDAKVAAFCNAVQKMVDKALLHLRKALR